MEPLQATPRVCPACELPLVRCDAEVVDVDAMTRAEREAWLDGAFGWFQCDGCGEVVELAFVPPPSPPRAPGQHPSLRPHRWPGEGVPA